MSTLQLMLPVKLSSKELYTRSNELSEELNRRRTIEIEKKLATGGYSKQLKELDQHIYELSDVVRTGAEQRKVLCKERFNSAERVIETYRLDTKQIVATRPLKDGDRQGALPGVDDSQGALELEGPGEEDDDDEEDPAPH